MDSARPRPVQVKAAVALLIASVALGTFRVEAVQFSHPWVYIVYVIAVLLAVGIYFGFNIARLIFISLFLLTLGVVVTHIVKFQEKGDLNFVSLVIQLTMEAVACRLLRTKSSVDWFYGGRVGADANLD